MAAKEKRAAKSAPRSRHADAVSEPTCFTIMGAVESARFELFATEDTRTRAHESVQRANAECEVQSVTLS